MSVLKKSLPIVIPSFVNKCGTIGLSLLPMFLVAEKFSAVNATLIMSLVKGSIFAGNFLGGLCSDRFGLKTTLLTSFLLSGTGMILLPVSSDFYWVAVFGMFTQMGSSMFPTSARLLITRLVNQKEQKESIGWLRTANNMGSIVSYTIGYLVSAIGISGLMVFDAITSYLAVLFAVKQIPSESEFKKKNMQVHEKIRHRKDVSGDEWILFFMTAIVIGGFSLLYELYMTATAARCEMIFGHDGLRVYSKLMVINTIFCTMFAVKASKTIKNPHISFPIGIVFLCLSLIVSLWGEGKVWLYSSALILTMGETFFLALSSYVLISVTPKTKAQGSIYGFAMVIQNSGKVLGGAFAFPLIIHGNFPILFVSVISVPILIVTAFLNGRLKPFWQKQESAQALTMDSTQPIPEVKPT